MNFYECCITDQLFLLDLVTTDNIRMFCFDHFLRKTCWFQNNSILEVDFGKVHIRKIRSFLLPKSEDPFGLVCSSVMRINN
jgi:hypothetical protein